MATRQYIGARYVPKFYENSDGTSEWRSGVIYEPLTIVTWSGNSYTSKKVVPANVGNPSANPAYWVATGIFNQQLDDVSTRLASAESDIAVLESEPNIRTGFKHVILISDSYGNPAVCGGTSWEDYVQTEMSDRSITKYWWGGAGFGWLTSSEYYYPSLLANMTADAEADLVLLLAGGNDGNLIHGGDRSRADIRAGITDGLNVIRGKFPNAQIKIGFVGRYKDPYRVDPYAEACKEYMQCQKLGYEYVKNSQFVLFNRETMIGDSDIHPTLAGSRAIADMAKLVIEGNSYVFTYNSSTTFGTTETIVHADEHIASLILRRTLTDAYPFVALPVNADMTPYSTVVEINQWFPLDFSPSENSGCNQIVPTGYTDENSATQTGAFMIRTNNNRGLVLEALHLKGALRMDHVKTLMFPQQIVFTADPLYV